MPVFGIVGREGRPFGSGGGRDSSRVRPLVDAGDQLMFPVHAKQLPGPERQEYGTGERDPGGPEKARPRGGGARFTQGMSCICCTEELPAGPMDGIILWFRWYMTQIEPISTIATSTMVKISASKVQPPSEREFMCRK